MPFLAGVANLIALVYVCYCVCLLVVWPEQVDLLTRYCAYTTVLVILVTQIRVEIARARLLCLVLRRLHEDHRYIEAALDVDKSGWSAAELEEFDTIVDEYLTSLVIWQDKVEHWPWSWLYRMGWIRLPERKLA